MRSRDIGKIGWKWNWSPSCRCFWLIRFLSSSFNTLLNLQLLINDQIGAMIILQIMQLSALGNNHSEDVSHLIVELSNSPQFNTSPFVSRPSDKLRPRCHMAQGSYWQLKPPDEVCILSTRLFSSQFPNHNWRVYLLFHSASSQIRVGRLQYFRTLLLCPHRS